MQSQYQFTTCSSRQNISPRKVGILSPYFLCITKMSRCFKLKGTICIVDTVCHEAYSLFFPLSVHCLSNSGQFSHLHCPCFSVHIICFFFSSFFFFIFLFLYLLLLLNHQLMFVCWGVSMRLLGYTQRFNYSKQIYVIILYY